MKVSISTLMSKQSSHLDVDAAPADGEMNNFTLSKVMKCYERSFVLKIWWLLIFLDLRKNYICAKSLHETQVGQFKTQK